jgi:hypothetical protein
MGWNYKMALVQLFLLVQSDVVEEISFSLTGTVPAPPCKAPFYFSESES